MKLKTNHTIQKFSIEVNTTSEKEAYWAKDNLHHTFKHQILPELEEFLDQYIPASQIVRLEHLNLDLQLNDLKDIDSLKWKIIKEIEDTLPTFANESNLQVVDEDQKRIKEDIIISQTLSLSQAYLYFLKNGTLTWWTKQEELKEILDGNWENLYKEKARFTTLLKEQLRFDSKSLERLIKQQRNLIEFVTFFLLEKSVSPAQIKSKYAQLQKDIFSNIASDKKSSLSNQFWLITINHIVQPNKVTLIDNIVSWFSSLNKFKLHGEGMEGTLQKLKDKNIKKNFGKGKANQILRQQIGAINIFFSQFMKPQMFEKLKLDFETRVFDKFVEMNTNEILQLDQSKSKIKTKSLIKNLKEKELFKAANLKNEALGFPDLQNGNINFNDGTGGKESLHKGIIFESLKNEDKASAIYLNHAGLILIHPFISGLFKKCQITSEDGKILDFDLALHVLYFIATKNEQPAEFELELEKLLCGIEIHQVVNRNVSLSAEIKNECEEMLEALIDHWNALKNSSTDLLRGGFFMREGKLEILEQKSKLKIARKTEDILLEKIPWNISMIKTPWMKSILYVEW